MKQADVLKELGISRPTWYRLLRSGAVKCKQHPLTRKFIIDEKDLDKVKKTVANAIKN